MIADQRKKGGKQNYSQFIKKGIQKNKSYLHKGEDEEMREDFGRGGRGGMRGGQRGRGDSGFRGGRFERKPFVKP